MFQVAHVRWNRGQHVLDSLPRRRRGQVTGLNRSPSPLSGTENVMMGPRCVSRGGWALVTTRPHRRALTTRPRSRCCDALSAGAL
ncbi:Hypothetical protein CAP_5234 [Chondromyces apiculatus DSM 436]|uniref:Uncharacterized protein n=1 Tax=Chondromyces apiculatus DSM 436 TaxID=1192034 RepID=A0A017T3H1_9BACT|nr:Hypothetical protein CAP_5234 [Chondromyces apiculatus DSM 436]